MFDGRRGSFVTRYYARFWALCTIPTVPGLHSAPPISYDVNAFCGFTIRPAVLKLRMGMVYPGFRELAVLAPLTEGR